MAVASKRNLKHFGSPVTWRFADVLLETASGNEEGEISRFACHRVTLAEKSPTFLHIFEHQEYSLDEDGSKYILIKEVKAATMDKVLTFIYEEKLPDNLLDGDLLEASIHFQLEKLNELCLNLLPSQYSMSNVCSTLLVGYKLNNQVLKESAFHFIWNNLNQVASRPEFRDLLRTHDTLMTDILIMSKSINDSLSSRIQTLEKMNNEQIEEAKFTPYISTVDRAGNELPKFIGSFEEFEGVQKLPFPADLPVNICAVKVLVCHSFDLSGSLFSKLWTTSGSKCHTHWIKSVRVNDDMDSLSSEFIFPISDDRHIYTSLKAGCKEYPTINLYLIGYVLRVDKEK